MILSILALSNLAKTGAAPPEETAAMIGERSIMAGKIKLHNSGLSTTLTRIFCASALLATNILVSL